MKRKSIIVLVLIILMVVVVFTGYLYSNSVSFENFNLKDIFRFISDNKLTLIEKQIVGEFDRNENPVFIIMDNLIYKAGSQGIEVIDKEGKVIKAFDCKLKEPVMTKTEKKVFVGDREGNKVYVIESMAIIKEITLPGYVYNISFNNMGYGVITGVDKMKRTEISFAFIIDKNGETIFERFLTKFYALGASVSDNNWDITLNCLDTNGFQAKTYLEFLNMDKERTGGIVIEDNNLMPILTYTRSNEFFLSGKKGIMYYKDRELKWKKEYDNIVNTINYQNNQIIIAVNQNSNSSELFFIDYNGNIKNSLLFDRTINNIYEYSGIIAVNFGRECRFFNDKMEQIRTMTSIYDIYDIKFFNKQEAVLITDRSYVIDRIKY